MQYKIEPYKGIGKLALGMSLHEIYELLSSDYEVIQDYAPGVGGSIFFPSYGIFVSHNRSKKAVAFELRRPADPVFRGKHLLLTSFSELHRFFLAEDPDLEITTSDLRSPAFGIMLWREEGMDPEATPETVVVFEHGAYEKIY